MIYTFCVQSSLPHAADTRTILKTGGKRLQALHMHASAAFSVSGGQTS